MKIDIIDEEQLLTEEINKLVIDVLHLTLLNEKIPDNVELSLMIVTNEEIKHLNNEYRNKNEITDVLSFPMDDWKQPLVDHTIILGDIVISMDRAKEQAVKYNHSLEREIAFLAVHGLLHLLGYTHDTKENEQKMFAIQENVMKEFQLER